MPNVAEQIHAAFEFKANASAQLKPRLDPYWNLMKPKSYLMLLTIFVSTISILGEQSEAQKKGLAADNDVLKVEFRWIEPKFVDGLTEDWGRAIDCGKGKWFPHKKSILSADDIKLIRMTESYSTGKPRYRYCLEFAFNDSAIQKMVKACGDENGKRLAFIFVTQNGKNVKTSPFLTNSYFDKLAPEKFRAPSSGSAPKEITEKVLSAINFKGMIPFEPSSWRALLRQEKVTLD